MKEKNGNRFGSVATISLIFAVALILGVLIENIIVTNLASEYAKQNVIISSKASLEVIMGQIDNAIVNLSDSVVSLMNNDEDYLWLTHNKKRSDQDYIYYNHLSALIEKMDQNSSGLKRTQGWFAYFPVNDQALYRGYNSDIYDYLKQIITGNDVRIYRGIHFLKLNGRPYVYALYSKNNSWCGAWISLSNVYSIDAYKNSTEMVFEIDEDLDEEGWTRLNNQRAYRIVVKSSMIDICIAEVRIINLFSGKTNIKLIVIFTIVAVIIATIFILWMYKNMILPLQKLKLAINTVEQGDLEYRIDPSDSKNEFEVLNTEFNSMLEQVRNLKVDVYEMKLRHQKTELRYLSQQVRPHFILNALNIIYSYQEKDFPQVKRMVMMLTKYFRYITNVHSDFVPLKMEFEQIENYLDIQKVRYPQHFDYSLVCDEKLDFVGIPPLIIQSFVENSIKYAINPKGTIEVRVTAKYIDYESYLLTIEDNGCGYDEEILANIQSVLSGVAKNTGGIGVRNSIDRLKILYGNQVDIQIMNKDHGGACAKIKIPCHWIDSELE